LSSEGFLAALQLADSALPVGRFGHSYGLEAYLSANQDEGAAQILELVETVVAESAGPLDAAASVRAHRLLRSQNVEGLIALDAAITARKLAPSSRAASTTCGRRLAALIPTLTSNPVAADLGRRVAGGETVGNIAAVEGVVAAALGVTELETALLALAGTTTSLLSAAVRLGRLSASDAQGLLRELHPAIVEAGQAAVVATRLQGTLPELEIYAMSHTRADVRLFVT